MILPGHGDLKPRRVYGFTADGKLLVDDGNNGASKYDLSVSPSGALLARPPQPVPIDQLGERQHVPVAQRWQGVDQPVS